MGLYLATQVRSSAMEAVYVGLWWRWEVWMHCSWCTKAGGYRKVENHCSKVTAKNSTETWVGAGGGWLLEVMVQTSDVLFYRVDFFPPGK